LAEQTYFKDILEGIKTTLSGLRISMKHFKKASKSMSTHDIQHADYFNYEGAVTLQYPHESIPVPDNGRYRLDNEMDDCIVCDKCAKVCPVDCIEIEPIKATEQVGVTSDGSPIRLYAAKFDIDMAKCCFCGLCTTVCPTECLTMTKAYDFSEFDVKDFNYHYANLSPDQATEKKELYQQFVAEKEAAKLNKPAVADVTEEKPLVARPSFKPSFKKPETAVTENTDEPKPQATKPVFKPVFKKPASAPTKEPTTKMEVGEEPPKPAAAKPVFKPVFKKRVPGVSDSDSLADSSIEVKKDSKESTEKSSETTTENKANVEEISTTETPKPAANRPVFKPVFKKPVDTTAAEIKKDNSEESPLVEKPNIAAKKPIFKPVYKKPVSTENSEQVIDALNQEPTVEAAKPVEERQKPKFVPKFKKPE
jgi:formate hydrogenlyase subunit 6/NADH:ubiquinone oxidoreductase subunit I